MSLARITCGHCGRSAAKQASAVNRAHREGAPLYCGRTCAGLARRSLNTHAEKREAKAIYDMCRRFGPKRAVLLEQKRCAYHAKVAADPVAARAAEREARKRRMPRHVEYCRRPEYRKWKEEYDRKYRSRKKFGDFGEAAIVLNDLIAEINARITRTEIYRQNGTLNKWLTRRRQYVQAVGS